jgi:hypothetical protein
MPSHTPYEIPDISAVLKFLVYDRSEIALCLQDEVLFAGGDGM